MSSGLETALLLLGGLAMLTIGGELLVRGSVRVAEQLSVSPLLIGLTLVGFGTSTPELVTSVQAALIGSPGIAIGNIVGSNIANILLILGVSGLIFPITVEGKALGRDGVFVVATALLLLVVGMTVGLQRWTGFVFLFGLTGYLVYAYRQERTAGAVAGDHTAAFGKAEAFEAVDPALRPGPKRGPGLAAWVVPLATAIAGLVTIIFGGRFLVEGAVDLARVAGLSETIIGLTIVAAGTSAPELITSLVAAVRRQTDMALGNILGSCIYNVLGIGGFTALIAPTPVPAEIVRFDMPVMVAASSLLLLFAWTGRRISRGEGAVFLGLYVTYVAYLIVT
jgi:cation:H+ antiporter